MLPMFNWNIPTPHEVCGVCRPEDAQCAIGAGANLIGVIFAKSKRQVTSEQVRNEGPGPEQT